MRIGKQLQKFICGFIVFTLLFVVCSIEQVKAAEQDFILMAQDKEVTIYTGNQYWESASISYWYSSEEERAKKQKQVDNYTKSLSWTTSNPEVVGFFDCTSTDPETLEIIYHTKKEVTGESFVDMVAKKEGSSIITVTSSKLNQSVKIKVTVKYAELTNNHEVFYDHNTYNFIMEGNAKAESYASSNEKVATVDHKTGKVTTLKTGKTIISCIADDGKEYTYPIQVQKRGLSYKELTSYYFTGGSKGTYTEFPLVASGIKVKTWKSSNTKVCKIDAHGNVAILQSIGTGKCTITCTAKDGTKYTCKLTVLGGTTWSGLGGYTPTLSEVKTHGFYKDINSVRDYGNVIVAIYDYANEFSFKNGNKKMVKRPDDEMRQIMRHRFGYEYKNGGGDFVQVTTDNKKKRARIWLEWYYVEED